MLIPQELQLSHYYVLQQWDVRPTAMERTSCHNGTYVLLQWDVIIHYMKPLSLKEENA